jgi:precorrin-6A/cobalt-precorrin-6A reductase
MARPAKAQNRFMDLIDCISNPRAFFLSVYPFRERLGAAFPHKKLRAQSSASLYLKGKCSNAAPGAESNLRASEPVGPIFDQQTSSNSAVNSAAHVLLLGGTSESWELAALLSGRSDVIVVSSLAGRVSQPRVPRGLVRVGGFGGVDGLIAYLKANKIAAVIDATHPFAVRISQNAEAACKELALPLIALARPAWVKAEGDIWHEVQDFHAAASLIERMQGRVFLSIGRQELAAFADCRRATYLIRAIEQPTPPLPLHHRVILERGPFDLHHERKLLCEHSIDVIVSKNSGGIATYSKIAAARDLRLPVVMISQPQKSTGRTVNTVNEVCIELDRIIGNRCSPRPARATEAAR